MLARRPLASIGPTSRPTSSNALAQHCANHVFLSGIPINGYLTKIAWDEVALDEIVIVRNGYWTKWLVDELALDEVAIGRNGY